MDKRSNIKMTVLAVLSVSLLVAATITFFLTLYCRHAYFHALGGFCERIVQEYPDSRQTVLEILKTQDLYSGSYRADETILTAFGYQPSDLDILHPILFWIAISGFFAGGLLFSLSFWYQHRRSATRIQALTEYLEKIGTGSQGSLIELSDDGFSKLQDEIYKTVTTLYQTRDEALTARNDLAENLSNIAHQLKTPLTSISLTIQMAKKRLSDTRTAEMSQEYASIMEIERQIDNLIHLEEALLLLSRIDAGTLILDRRPTDVFTILTLASDNLYSLSMQKGVLIDVPEMGAIDIEVDLDWTMGAVLNLMKNCMEATATGTTVHCSYEKNPLYVQIRIWDEGEGFAKEDLPHLFERFYRGEKTKNTGIGIGLSLSREIIEMQNGIIRAFNLPNGGACFEIRFYSH